MNLQHFLSRKIPSAPWDEFVLSDQFPLDDEEIADTAINAMLLAMNNALRASSNQQTTIIEDYVPLVLSGIRFPWKDRIALANCIDTINDELPSLVAIGLTRKEKKVFAQAVSCATVNFKSLPKSVKTALHGADLTYRTSYIRGHDGMSRAMVMRGSRDIETVVDAGYAGVMPDGVVIGVDLHGRINRWYGIMLSYAVSIYNDRRYFWEVTASEEFWEKCPVKAIFSINEEYIKSLFYARSIPITATGRLRPILHWVSAHQRRIKEGVDIDVRKHLRGIEEFEMHNVNFAITSPQKFKPLTIKLPHQQ